MSPRPAPDCRLAILDDEGVLLCEGLECLFALNTAATFLWIGLERGANEDELARDLAATFDLAPENAADQVADALAAWSAAGLLAGSEHERPALSRPPPEPIAALPAAPPAIAQAAVHRYRLLDSAFTVSFDEETTCGLAHPVLAHLESASSAAHTHALRIAQVGNEEFLVEFDGRTVHRCRGGIGLAPLVKSLILRHALNDHVYLFVIHAGALAKDGRVLLLPAASGRGKSSLTAALMQAGWSYLSDETAPVRMGDLRVRPVPLALGFKRGAWSLLAGRLPALAHLPTHDREDGERVRYLPPTSFAPDIAPGYPVRWIVFPDYAPGRTTELLPLARAGVLVRLFEECVSLPGRIDTAFLDALVGWAGGIEGFALPNGDLDQAVERLETLAAGEA